MSEMLQMLDELEQENEYDAEESKETEKPKKNQKSKTIYVPKVQNMDNYFLKHYKDYTIQELNKRLVDGQLEEVVGVPVKSEQILPGECCFQRFNYWRINKSDFWIDIDLRLELRVETPAGIDTDFYWFVVELWFFFDDNEEECAFESIKLLENKEEHEECWKLDKHLVPVLRRDEIDKYSEAMWEQYYPEAAKDPKQRNPRELAKKMGLTITNIRLYKRNHIKGIIFFHKSIRITEFDWKIFHRFLTADSLQSDTRTQIRFVAILKLNLIFPCQLRPKAKWHRLLRSSPMKKHPKRQKNTSPRRM